MADSKKDTKDAPATAKPAQKRGGKIGFFFFMIAFGAAVPFIFPTLMLLLIGMIPTLVAIMTDNDRHKSSVASVGAMNAAGVTPFAIDLWSKGQTMENTFHILRDPSNWLVILGAAGIGQLILFAVPQAVASLSIARSEARLKLLRKNLESLKESWGADVGTTKPLDRLGLGE
ncbi:MAG: hypothetical protein M3N08_06695 [Pseudomonadota bacterium]|nr:hypothetical protein [Pseudomonadota bacterium]